jgi:hypothetical protein
MHLPVDFLKATERILIDLTQDREILGAVMGDGDGLFVAHKVRLAAAR